MIIQQTSFYIPSTFYGIFFCCIPMFPFPAVIPYGALKGMIETWLLFAIWTSLFVLSLTSIIGLSMIRLQGISRPESPLKLRAGIQAIILVIFFILVLLSFENICFMARSSPEAVDTFLFNNFPKYAVALENHYPIIVIDDSVLYTLAETIVIVTPLIVMFYMFLRLALYYEIKKEINKISAARKKYHEKLAKHSAIQILAKCLCITTFFVWMVVSYFLSHEMDTIWITCLLHTVFVGAPIPGTILMFVQNVAYSNYIKQKLWNKSSYRIESKIVRVLSVE
ncbi:unnamed protein product [Caenorhabditis angaria]|uniref:Uncharacterized protein n=1 Tax=Caenorhabditis angaria TaxID=860376 RepID=A0A9P1IM71_9PELO|nr:unnamed protein product [Caenorhabditis angaria]